jgi:ParB/RepB/Spo0J family partition protein
MAKTSKHVEKKETRNKRRTNEHQRRGAQNKESSGGGNRSRMELALLYAAEGLPVVPLHGKKKNGSCTCGAADCRLPGRHPRGKLSLEDAGTERLLIEKRWAEWPLARIGVALGTPSRVLALVIKGKAGQKSLRKLLERNGTLKKTVTIRDGGVLIRLFRVPKGCTVLRRELGEGLTILGDGDLVVMPSRSGIARPGFVAGRALGQVKIAEAPKWLVDIAAIGAPLVGAPRIVATRDIRIEDIAYRDRLRPVRPENVAKLAESLKTLGTQTRSISVRPDPERDGKFLIIAGATLFEAAKSLNWTHIRADIMECTEVEARLWEAMENLYRTELTVLEQAEHQAECVRLIVEREAVSRQNVAKPKGGRPEGAIAKAAHELPMKGRTQQARRKAIERGLKIAAISSEAKVAVTKAGLDDNRSALREIAKVKTSEGQLKKVREFIGRQAKGAGKRNRVKKGAQAKGGTDDSTSQRAQRHPDDVISAELKTHCSREFKKTWAEAPTKVKRQFLREVLKWEGGKPLADKG